MEYSVIQSKEKNNNNTHLELVLIRDGNVGNRADRFALNLDIVRHLQELNEGLKRTFLHKLQLVGIVHREATQRRGSLLLHVGVIAAVIIITLDVT